MYELQRMPADDFKRYELEQLLRKRLKWKILLCLRGGCSSRALG